MRRTADHLTSSLMHLASGDPIEGPIADPGEKSPWATWLLICLFRQKLNVDELGELHKPLADLPRRPGGVMTRFHRHYHAIPFAPEIAYHSSESEIAIYNRVTGEDFRIGSTRPKELYLSTLTTLIQNGRFLELPEQRLLALHPSIESLAASASELVEFGFGDLLTMEREYGDVRIRFKEAAAPLLQAWHKVEARLREHDVRLKLAELFGDWSYLHDTAPSHAIPPDNVALIAECAKGRRKRLLKLAKDRAWLPTALHALADIAADEIPPIVSNVLHTKTEADWDGVNAIRAALQFVAKQKLAHLYPLVADLADQWRPRGLPQKSAIWWDCVQTLLEVGHSTERAMQYLKTAPCNLLSEAAVLSLRFAPELSRELFQRAITQGARAVPEFAAAVLAILDEPWTQKLLLDLLTESDDVRVHELCFVVLFDSVDPDVRKVSQELFSFKAGREPASVALMAVDYSLIRHTALRRSEEIFALRGRVK